MKQEPFVRLTQERAEADAVQEMPATERATAKWDYLNGQMRVRV